jgi:hypothetical protein
MSNIVRTTALAAIAALGLLGAAAPASAAVLGSISTADDNDGVQPIYGANLVNGFFGANWVLLGTSDITITFLGREAGFNNSFDFGLDGTDFTNSQTGSPSFNVAGVAPSITYFNVAPGLLEFSFTTPNGTVTNGSNPNNTSPNDVNFFTYVVSGNVIDLWLDDANDVDDNHDDMVIRLTASTGNFGQVPVPAALPLLLGALGGLGVMGRRRKS